MENEFDFSAEVVNGSSLTGNGNKCHDNAVRFAMAGDKHSGVASGQPGKRSRKASRKNYKPVKICREELEIETKALENGYVSDESDDYSVNVIAPEQGLPPLTQPSEEKLRCEQEATQMVNDANLVLGDRSIKSPRINDLIASLTSLMLQIKSLAKGDMNSVGYSSLTESISDLKKKIHPSNLKCFEDNVEVHIAHIQSGMSQMGNLHAFSEKHASY